MSLFGFFRKNTNDTRSPQFGEAKAFSKVLDNTSVSSERIQLLYKGALPSRNQNISYQFSVVRIVSSYRIATLPGGVFTHEFTCIYRDLQGVFKILFLFKFDCRLVNRNHDQIAKQIAEFLTNLLIDAEHCPIGISALVVSQQSIDFWLLAFEKRVKQLITDYEENDKRRSM